MKQPPLENVEYFSSRDVSTLSGLIHLKRLSGITEALCGAPTLRTEWKRNPDRIVQLEHMCPECERLSTEPPPLQNAALFFKSRLSAWIFDKYLRRQARRMARAEGKQMSKQNPTPDWDKIKKLAQRMNGLVDEIEKEIESGESRPFQNCFEDYPLGQKE